MAELILMCGCPGSGKSTYAKSFKTDKDIYISRDEIRASMIGPDEEYFSRETEVLQQFVDEINIALTKAERYVIADATHISFSSRMKVMSRIKDRSTIVNCIVMDIPLDIALERNSHRTGREFVPEHALKNMYNGLTPPQKGETIDKVVYVNCENKIIKTEKLGGRLW